MPPTKPTPEELKRDNKIVFFEPFPHQRRVLELIRGGKKVLLLQGANRIGKTVLGANLVGSFAFGVQPWDGKPTIFPPGPTRGRIICIDWEHHAREVIVPVLQEWLPKGSYITRKNNVGVDAYWDFPNGSSFELMTHIQDTKIHEGWKGDWVWSDEPLPHDKYIANRRGLIDTSGIFLMTMTAIYEPWIMDEIALSTAPHIGCVMEIPMNSNTILKQEDIDNYANEVPEDQREARIKGGWFQLAGKVLKGFSTDVNVVDTFPVPTDWPVVACIDLHLNVPQAVGFYGWDKFDRIFVVGETWKNITPEQIADDIIRQKLQNGWRLQNAYIDPLAKGDSAYVRNRFGVVEDSFRIIERKLSTAGIQLHSASKDKDSGIRNLQGRIKGPNGIPSLFIQRVCERHLYEVQRWVYDKDGKPMKLNDHMMENMYRATLSGSKYVDPVVWSKKLAYQKSGVV
jgi:hypothetical protein